MCEQLKGGRRKATTLEVALMIASRLVASIMSMASMTTRVQEAASIVVQVGRNH